MAALNAIKAPKIAIIGGYDRLLPLEHFGEYIRNEVKNLKHIVLVGDSKDRTAMMLKNAGVTNYSLCTARTMPAIIKDALSYATTGDAVVLSPGFASFGMFNNFEERGKLFKQAVKAL